MHKLFRKPMFWVTTMLMTTISAQTTQGEGTTLIQKGEAKAHIHLAAQPPATDDGKAARKALLEAIADLNYHLQKMSGTDLAIVESAAGKAIQPPAIVLGERAVELGAKPANTTTRKEAFRLLSKDGNVLIGGESEWAVVYGIYELLERLGCAWVMPGKPGEIIPQRKTVTVPPLDVADQPDFEYRRLWYRGGSRLNTKQDYAESAEWQRRQRMSTRPHPLTKAAGHCWDQLIRRHQAVFDANPEMLALIRGPEGNMIRKGPQIESTHPEVIRLFVDEIKATFAKNGWEKSAYAAFPIGPADGDGYSMSVASQNSSAGRIDPITGDPDTTDLVVKLGNDILVALGDEYPNVHLGFYLYSVHADYPARYRPHPRLVPIVAPINYSRLHCMTDSNSKGRHYFRGIMEQWIRLHEEQGNPMFFRGYNWNLAENMAPFTRLKMWGVDIPWYKRAGVIGMNVEATKAWAVNGPHDYLYAKLIWNADRGWQDILKEYCRHAFGGAAKEMEAYYLALVDRQHNSGHEAGSYHAIHLVFDQDFVTAAQARLDKAAALATTAQQKTLINFARIPLVQLGLYLKYHAATLEYDFTTAQQTLTEIKAHWQKAYEQRTDLVAKEVPQYFARFLERFVDQGVTYSTGPYRMLFKFPDALKTMHDPYVRGHLMGYHDPAINDSQHHRTRTFSTTWDAQGLAGIRDGAVWYRVHFAVPAELQGQPVGFFLGGVEDEARVWCNGNYIGAGRGFSLPFAFDLTDDVKAGTDNLLAIQVVRNSAYNEIGVGGILRPSFVFTGPRLPQKAPKQMVLGRILPGGELAPVR